MRPLLFTPGPANVTDTVKQAMTAPDVGSRDTDFMRVLREVREQVTTLAAEPTDYTTILLSGSGTSAMEAAVTSIVPPDGKLIVVVNGAYGQRLVEIANVHGINVEAVKLPWSKPASVRAIAEVLTAGKVSCVAMVHHETTTGLENPVAEVGKVAHEHGATFLVDAISSFGGIPFRLPEWNIDFMLGSSNKCLQGVAGAPFVIAERTALERLAAYPPRTVSLSLWPQFRSLEDSGQSLFTPNIPAILALRQALRELEEEGGVEARYKRYTQNWRALRKGLTDLGFELLLPAEDEAHLLVTVKQPEGLEYAKFYDALKARGITIYAGTLAALAGEATFRLGVIGDLHSADVERLLTAIAEVTSELNLSAKTV